MRYDGNRNSTLQTQHFLMNICGSSACFLFTCYQGHDIHSAKVFILA